MAVRGRLTRLSISTSVGRGRMTKLSVFNRQSIRGRMTQLTINPPSDFGVTFAFDQSAYSPFDLVPLSLGFVGSTPPDSVDWSRIRGFTAPGGTPSTMPQNAPDAVRWPSAWVDDASPLQTAQTPLTFLGSGLNQSFRMPGRQWAPSYYIRWVAHKAGHADITGEIRIDGFAHAGYYDPTGVIGYEYIAY